MDVWLSKLLHARPSDVPCTCHVLEVALLLPMLAQPVALDVVWQTVPVQLCLTKQ